MTNTEKGGEFYGICFVNTIDLVSLTSGGGLSFVTADPAAGKCSLCSGNVSCKAGVTEHLAGVFFFFFKDGRGTCIA